MKLSFKDCEIYMKQHSPRTFELRPIHLTKHQHYVMKLTDGRHCLLIKYWTGVSPCLIFFTHRWPHHAIRLVGDCIIVSRRCRWNDWYNFRGSTERSVSDNQFGVSLQRWMRKLMTKFVSIC